MADTAATFVLPQVYSAGIAIWPISDTDQEWNGNWSWMWTNVGWKWNRNLDVRLSTGGFIPQPQNWRSSYTVMIGTEFKYKWLRLPRPISSGRRVKTDLDAETGTASTKQFSKPVPFKESWRLSPGIYHARQWGLFILIILLCVAFRYLWGKVET